MIATVLLSAVVTAGVTWRVNADIAESQRQRLALEATRIDSAIEQRMDGYEQVLLGGVGLFTGRQPITRADFERYVGALRLPERYPGFKSITFNPAVPAADLAGFESAVRREPIPSGMTDPELLAGYTVRPPIGLAPDPQQVGAPILYIEPFTPENQQVLGIDTMQDPAVGRPTLLRADETGDAEMTASLRFSPADHRVSFISYLAVVVDGKMLGWLGAVFRCEQFMAGMVGDIDLPIHIEITDDQGSLLYTTSGVDEKGAPIPLDSSSGVSVRGSPDLAGTVWHVRYQATPDFGTATESAAPWLAAIGCALVGLLLIAVAVAAHAWRSRAIASMHNETMVRHRAAHDSLTGLPNRASFHERLRDACQDARPFAVAYIDIDGFKQVNDDHGHAAGDTLLVAIATRISSVVRDDDVVARLGGDEFAVLLPECPRVAQIAADIVIQLGEPFVLTVGDADVVAVVGASVGIARSPADGADVDALIHAADTAMLDAKRAGRGRYKFARDGDPILPTPATPQS